MQDEQNGRSDGNAVANGSGANALNKRPGEGQAGTGGGRQAAEGAQTKTAEKRSTIPSRSVHQELERAMQATGQVRQNVLRVPMHKVRALLQLPGGSEVPP